MQITSLSNNYSVNRQPSFGMAKLTQKGSELAQTFVSEMPEFIDTTCYKKGNLIAPMLKKASSGAEVDFPAFFEAGKTLYPSNNRQFIKKQVNGFFSYGAIKRFLKHQCPSPKGGGEPTISEKAQVLIDQLLSLFDANVSNPEVTSKEGKKILNLIEPYLSTDTLAPRNSVMTSKMFSKN